jgi:dienelactone hydrolase
MTVLLLFFFSEAYADFTTENITFTASIDGQEYLLEGKLYKPQTAKKQHPLVVMTHGRNGSNPLRDSNQIEGYKALNTTLAEKGYLVMMLVRRGYGNSQGPDSEFLHTAAESGLAGAKDVKCAIQYMRKRPDVINDKIVVMGQSQGGWIALASSTVDIEGVVGAVNISGAINFGQGKGLGIRSLEVEGHLEECSKIFGKTARVPVLWIYAENDNHLPSSVKNWFSAFESNGGKGSLVIKSPYKDNGHMIVTEPRLYVNDLYRFFDEIKFLPLKEETSNTISTGPKSTTLKYDTGILNAVNSVRVEKADTEIAVKFDNDNGSVIVKKVSYFVPRSSKYKTKFEAVIYDVSRNNGMPGKRLNSKTYFASAREGDEWVSIDINEEELLIEGSFFVSMKWLISPGNKGENAQCIGISTEQAAGKSWVNLGESRWVPIKKFGSSGDRNAMIRTEVIKSDFKQ